VAQDAGPLRFDYNDEVFRQGVEAHGLDYSILREEYRDVHPLVADRLASAGVSRVLDMGCGPTKLGALLDERGVPWVGVDAAIRRLELGRGERVLGDAMRLPFGDETFGAVTALYMLYHFEDPAVPVAEAWRVLRPGGLFAACAPSRSDDPELAPFLAHRAGETFDSDMAPELIGRFFEVVRVDAWDMPIYRLPDAQALWNHVIATSLIPDPDEARRVAEKLEYPLWLTKRGATVWGRKRRYAGRRVGRYAVGR
jgi:SAM-dependent methyltransferase